MTREKVTWILPGMEPCITAKMHKKALFDRHYKLKANNVCMLHLEVSHNCFIFICATSNEVYDSAVRH